MHKTIYLECFKITPPFKYLTGYLLHINWIFLALALDI